MIKIAKQWRDLLRTLIQSTHRSPVSYSIYIQYNKSYILALHCTCLYGGRVVGCCSHIASVIWYLSLARHDSELLRARSSSYLSQIKDAQDSSDISNSESDNSDDDDSNVAIFFRITFS